MILIFDRVYSYLKYKLGLMWSWCDVYSNEEQYNLHSDGMWLLVKNSYFNFSNVVQIDVNRNQQWNETTGTYTITRLLLQVAVCWSLLLYMCVRYKSLNAYHWSRTFHHTYVTTSVADFGMVYGISIR